MLDCNGILELDSKAATRNALKQNYYLPIGAKDPNDKQPFSFQWSILSFVFSGTSFLCCKFFWKFMESNHLTFLSSKCQDSLLEPEKRGELATDIVSYLNKCERGQNLMKKYVHRESGISCVSAHTFFHNKTTNKKLIENFQL